MDTTYALELAADGAIHAEGLLDWINTKSISATDTLKNVAAFAILAWFFIQACKTRTWAAIVGALLLGAVVLFAINGGMAIFQKKTADEIGPASASVLVLDSTPPDLR